MPRLHLFEIEDQPWCPAAVRDTLTDTLAFVLNRTNRYGPIVPRLRRALERTGARRILDLCSGAGGPWLRLLPQLEGGGAGEPRIDILLTDRYLNRPALERVRGASGHRIDFHPHPVDATRVPPELDGFRTLFTAFHHFRPADARAILEDAVREGQGIAIFEVNERRLLSLLILAFAPLAVLFAVPFLRPFRAAHLLWTYVIPVAPVAALVDGVVSCLRAYSPAELRELSRGLCGGRYTWEIGRERGGLWPGSVTYLIGYPETGSDLRSERT